MKKLYMQPCVEAAQLQLNSMVLAGSPGAIQNSGSGTGSITTPNPGDPIVGG